MYPRDSHCVVYKARVICLSSIKDLWNRILGDLKDLKSFKTQGRLEFSRRQIIVFFFFFFKKKALFWLSISIHFVMQAKNFTWEIRPPNFVALQIWYMPISGLFLYKFMHLFQFDSSIRILYYAVTMCVYMDMCSFA